MGIHILEVTFRLGNLCCLSIKQVVIGSNSNEGHAHGTSGRERRGEEKGLLPSGLGPGIFTCILQPQKAQETKDF